MLIRNVPEDVLDALKRRAAANERSLQKELLRVLREAASAAPPRSPLPPLDLAMAQGEAGEAWSREEIYGDDGR